MPVPALRLACFAALYGAMYWALSSFWSAGLAHFVIDTCTVAPAAWLARGLTGNAQIVAAGASLQAPDGSIRVLYGCEGTDVLMVLLAALLAAPGSWRGKLTGVLAGAALVYMLNQTRVLALFYAVRRAPTWFGAIHGLIAPMVVVIVVVAFFLAWLRWTAPRPASADIGISAA